MRKDPRDIILCFLVGFGCLILLAMLFIRASGTVSSGLNGRYGNPPDWGRGPSLESRISQLEQENQELRRQVNPTPEERRWMVIDERTGAWRDRTAADLQRPMEGYSPADRQLMSGSIPHR